LSLEPNEGVMLAVTGTRAGSSRGGFSKPTTPKTLLHHDSDRMASSSEET
jgi:hypothetical protein